MTDARTPSDHHQDAQDALVEDRAMRPPNAMRYRREVPHIDTPFCVCDRCRPDLRGDPLENPDLNGQRADFERRYLHDEHPSWCKCQRVCGGDQ